MIVLGFYRNCDLHLASILKGLKDNLTGISWITLIQDGGERNV